MKIKENSFLDYLMHHGIDGMKWGIKNGPPYPLNQSTIANGHAKKLNNYKGHLYFVSEEKLDGQTLNPRVPRNYLTMHGYEDKETPRISFAPSIDQCLAGLSQNLDDKEFYVYEPDDISKCEVYKPDTTAVPDSGITDELWVTNPTAIRSVKKIKITGNRGEAGKTYKYGKNQAVLFDDWEYEDI